MTPIEAAVKAAQDANILKWHPGDFEDSVMASDIAPIITAFLEAAAEDAELCERIGKAAQNPPPNHLTTRAHDEGKTAILALKEAVNAG